MDVANHFYSFEGCMAVDCNHEHANETTDEEATPADVYLLTTFFSLVVLFPIYVIRKIYLYPTKIIYYLLLFQL